ncbi:MAG: GIY-YIG nuclease family protein [Patescibacteria group bacterium]|nr:GIY-YIG nuclease family protein [Patescibacteria group bacterium]
MYYVYILFSQKDRKLYIGYTNNLRRRMLEHRNGMSLATSNRRPLELIYYEAYSNQKDAMSREKYYKTGWGRNYVKKVLQNCLKGKK